ncbi:TIGR01777 family oxidoreductase [Fluviicola sp.]|uniref:TIGR01777 family oxidoreductase n=1 Tax=Fluviicola sp. TaxID=1917219 RepID=UPI00261CE6BE|nr:TIGR01777 family oxidoreductase [Fluviicola sp.]
MKKIVLFAANGFIGKALIDYTVKNHPDYQITAISRTLMKNLPASVKQVQWDGKTKGNWTIELEHADLVINLAGKSVNCRYTRKNKAAIFASRLDSTRIIGEAIEDCINKPKCWMNMASATIYEHSLENPNTEKNGIIGKGFSVNVCKAWEKQFFAFKDLPVRQIVLRTTIVLGESGGVYPVLKRLTRFGLGGKMGKGNQQISWIHIEDFCSAVFFLFENNQAIGIYNVGSPNPVRNKLFQFELRKSLNIHCFINHPKIFLRLGALIIGTENELVLKSRFIHPEQLNKLGFQFQFPSIDLCLNDLKNKNKQKI